MATLVADVSMESTESDQDQAIKMDESPSLDASEVDAARNFYSTYELQEVLGRGMASVVRKCTEKRTSNEYAVKIVDITTERQSVKEATRLLQETMDEVSILKELQGHQSIIVLHDFYQTSTFLFLIFQMAPQGELFDVLTKAVTFSEKRTKRYMRQIMEGIEYLHSRDIIHRDMKLENILAIDDERIVLTDFGFAKKIYPADQLRDLCGTPGYLAPEVLRCQMYEDAPGYNKEVDLWACGVIMYTLLAGYAPFYHRRQMIMLRMIQEGKYDFNPEQWESVSNDAKDLIKKLLVVDPVDRITAKDSLIHPFLAKTITDETAKSKTGRQKFKSGIWCVRFLLRLQNIRQLKKEIDRATLRKRPFRDRQIRHDTEATVFLVFGHWVNRGYQESRDMLFANRTRPKIRRVAA